MTSTPESGLQRFVTRLHPDVVAEVERWGGDPTLGKLYASLNHHTTLKSFLDVYAEAVVARHLQSRGCALRLEVPTPGGKACDFEVTSGDVQFYLHVKRVDTERPSRRLTISSRLRYLERIRRPYVVRVRWHEGTTDEEMERLVRSASEFIQHAQLGDELVVRDDAGQEIGGVLIAGPCQGTHVSLAIGLPSGFIDEAPRMRRLMRRAYSQFMPRASNVILICSSQPEDDEDFARALLGSHVERWDAYPPKGRRVAHGRAADGLWHGRRYADSIVAGWFRLDPASDELEIELRRREDAEIEPKLDETLTTVLG